MLTATVFHITDSVSPREPAQGPGCLDAALSSYGWDKFLNSVQGNCTGVSKPSAHAR